jgi:hypothetical protein
LAARPAISFKSRDFPPPFGPVKIAVSGNLETVDALKPENADA